MKNKIIECTLFSAVLLGLVGFVASFGLAYTQSPETHPFPAEWSLQTPYQDYIVTEPLILDNGILHANWHGSLLYASNYVLIELEPIIPDDSPSKKRSSNLN